MIKTYDVDFFERLRVPENRICDLMGVPISGIVQVYALDEKCSRISITCVRTIINYIYIPDEFKVGSEIEIEYSCRTKGDDNKQMTKSDLKTGMKVDFKNGCSGIILKDTVECDIISLGSGTFKELKHWNENLSHKYCKDLDVDSVWAGNCVNECLQSRQDWNLVTFTDIPRDVTLEDIEKKFGYKVKIVNKI